MKFVFHLGEAFTCFPVAWRMKTLLLTKLEQEAHIPGACEGSSLSSATLEERQGDPGWSLPCLAHQNLLQVGGVTCEKCPRTHPAGVIPGPILLGWAKTPLATVAAPEGLNIAERPRAEAYYFLADGRAFPASLQTSATVYRPEHGCPLGPQKGVQRGNPGPMGPSTLTLQTYVGPATWRTVGRKLLAAGRAVAVTTGGHVE